QSLKPGRKGAQMGQGGFFLLDVRDLTANLPPGGKGIGDLDQLPSLQDAPDAGAAQGRTDVADPRERYAVLPPQKFHSPQGGGQPAPHFFRIIAGTKRSDTLFSGRGCGVIGHPFDYRVVFQQAKIVAIIPFRQSLSPLLKRHLLNSIRKRPTGSSGETAPRSGDSF